MNILNLVMAIVLISVLLSSVNFLRPKVCLQRVDSWRGAWLPGLLVVLLAVSQSGCREAEPDSLDGEIAAPAGQVAATGVREFSADDRFETLVLAAEKPVLVDFYAEWCGPCRRLLPILEELAVARQDTMSIIKVDIDQHPELAREYGVRGVPHLIIFHDGRLVDQASGFRPRAALEEWIDRVLTD